MTEKKRAQLGMNPSTAAGRLVKDVLFGLLVESGKNRCWHCSEPMERENFSIEHKTPWLDSANPKQAFFDLENISFSHLRCNIGAGRRERRYETAEDQLKNKRDRWSRIRLERPVEERQRIRREQYRRTGK